jgi:hypothetical protein
MSRKLGAIFIVVAIISAALSVKEFLAVDSCLDSGGSFDYESGTCDKLNSHPYAPNTFLWTAALLLGFVGGVLIVVGERKGNAI